MKNYKFFFMLLMTYTLSAQVPENIIKYRSDEKGDIKNRKNAFLSGNNIRSFFSNAGEISGVTSAPTLEWPNGTGHNHLYSFSLLVGAKVKFVNGSGQEITFMSVETQSKEGMDKDPISGEIWGLEPKAGYFNPDSNLIATSTNKNSWPAVWPTSLGVDSSWSGNWFGYFGKGTRDSVVETFYVMDDSRDKEFTRPPYGYFPIQGDSTVGGLGLRIETREMQFQNKGLEDILFWNYDVTNISDYSFDSTSIGFCCYPVISDGGYLPNLNMLYFNGKSLGGVTYQGYCGIVALNNITNSSVSNITSEAVGDQSNRFFTLWPRNDAVVWANMIGGVKDTVLPNSGSLIFVTGSNIFSLPKWKTIRYSLAMVFGNSVNEIIAKRNIAQRLYQNNFVVTNEVLYSPIGKGQGNIHSYTFNLYDNFPNPFNPTTVISFNIPSRSIVTLKIFDGLGREVAVLVSDELEAGTYSRQWNAAGLASGVYFYRLQAGSFVETKKLLLMK